MSLQVAIRDAKHVDSLQLFYEWGPDGPKAGNVTGGTRRDVDLHGTSITGLDALIVQWLLRRLPLLSSTSSPEHCMLLEVSLDRLALKLR